ncbi:hypothetical protein [Acrocarpospora catenulata]|uniref:hypothetical protein n=1 Tax=Acrocarpospora catenulata TaxID=2836182 RepID=UPI001BD9160D|nr:hypothetical protein [Acrocarpospora catenulata]
MKRRAFLALCGGITLTGACAGPDRPAASPSLPPKSSLLYAETPGGLSVIDSATGLPLAAAMLADTNWNRLYTLTGRSLITLDGKGGELTRTPVPGGAAVRTVSPSGLRVVLADPAPADPYGAGGRTTTRLVVADPTGARPARTYKLDGNYQPDAFSTADSHLFLVDYLPAGHPEGYRVRVLDLATGAVGPVLTRLKQAVPEGAEEIMRGDGRLGVPSPEGDRLYTLYTHQPNHLHTRDLVAGRSTGVHAFVHVLSLTEHWAYCLDLPDPFGHGPAESHAVAVSPSGLYVFDTANGQVLRAQTPDLEAVSTAAIPKSEGPAHAAATDDAIYLAAGTNVLTLDPHTLAVRHTTPIPGTPRGLTVDRDGTFWLGLSGAAVHLAPSDGAELARVSIPGLVALRHARLML